MHRREQIRQAVVDMLMNNTAAQDRVYSNKVYPVAKLDVPAIAVYTKSEEVINSTLSQPVSTMRELETVIVLYASSSNMVDKIIDDLALEIEVLLGQSCTGLTGAITFEYASFEVDFSPEGNKQIAVAQMGYVASYEVDNDNPV